MNTVCTACMATNRLPEERIDDGAKCGRCGHSLFDGEVINATAETLDKLLQDDLPMVIDSGALVWAVPQLRAHLCRDRSRTRRKSSFR